MGGVSVGGFRCRLLAGAAALLAAAVWLCLLVPGVTEAATGPFPLVPGSPFETGGGNQSGNYGIAYSPNGKFVVVSNYDAGTVASLAVQPDNLSLVNQVATGANPQGIAYSPTGDFVAAVNYDAHTVSMLKVSASGRLTKAGAVSVPVGEEAAFNPSGTLLAVSNQVGNVTTFSVSATGALTRVGTVSVGEGISFDLAFSPSGDYLAAVDTESRGTTKNATVSVYSVDASGKLTRVDVTPTGPAYNGSTGSIPDGVAFSPSGALLAVSDNFNNDVLMYSVSSTGTLRKLHAPYPTETGPAGIAFNPAGTLLATADSGTSGDVSIFTVSATGSLSQVQDEPADGSGGPQSVAFSPDGDLLGVANLFAGSGGSASEYDTAPTAS